MKQKTCPICGKHFSTSRPNKKYCSFTCKAAGHIVMRMKWEEAHPNYHAEYMRQKRKAQRETKGQEQGGF